MKHITSIMFAVFSFSLCAMWNPPGQGNENAVNQRYELSGSVDLKFDTSAIKTSRHSDCPELGCGKKARIQSDIKNLFDQKKCVAFIEYIDNNIHEQCLIHEIENKEGNDVYKYIVKQRFNDDISNCSQLFCANETSPILMDKTGDKIIDSCFNTYNLLAKDCIKKHFARCYDMLNFAKQLMNCTTTQDFISLRSNFKDSNIDIKKSFFYNVVLDRLQILTNSICKDNPFNIFFNKNIWGGYCKNIWYIDTIDSNNIFFLDDDRVATFADLINTDQVSMDTAENDLHDAITLLKSENIDGAYNFKQHLLKKILLFTCLLKKSSDENDDRDFFKTIKDCNISYIELESAHLESLRRFDVALSSGEICSFFYER